MITPGAIVGDVHALLALAGGCHQRAVHVDHRQVEESSRLLLPDALADLVENVLKDVDVALGEAAAEVARGGRVGDAAGARNHQKNYIRPSQLPVFARAAPSKGVG